MIIKANNETYIVQFRKDLHERETKCQDKFHRNITIQWDELTVSCSITKVYKRDKLQKTIRYEGMATSSYMDTISVPVGRWIALKRAVSLMRLPCDQAAHIIDEVGKQVKLRSHHADKVPPKAYVELKYIIPKKDEATKTKRAELKALTDQKYKEYLKKKEAREAAKKMPEDAPSDSCAISPIGEAPEVV